MHDDICDSPEAMLVESVGKGQYEEARELLAEGTNPNFRHPLRGRTALMAAATRRNGLAMMRELLEAGADASMGDAFGGTPLSIASGRGDLAMAELLLSAGADPDDRRSLLEASREGHAEVVRKLVDAGAVPGYHDLEGAARGDHIDTLKILLERLGPMDRFFLKRDRSFPTPSESTRLLFEACGEERTPLMEASRSGDVDAARSLLEEGGDADRRSKEGRTALMWAALWGRAETAGLLLASGADPNARDASGDTALLMASALGCADVARLLLKAGADVDARALHAAAEDGRIETARILLEAGADINSADDRGLTPVMKASGDLLKELIAEGADVNARSKGGITALMRAAGRCLHYDVKILLKSGADMLAKDDRGMTALDHAREAVPLFEGNPEPTIKALERAMEASNGK